MTSLTLCRPDSAFLCLPAEVRLHIYGCLLPAPRLDINLCDLNSSQSTQHLPLAERWRLNPSISTSASQNLAIDAISRSNGLHLLFVSTFIAREVNSLLSQLAVRFHCPKCFDRWLRNNSYGLGVGIQWLKRIEILFDVESELRMSQVLQDITPKLSRRMVREMLEECQHTAYAYYGRMDLMAPSREKWTYEAFGDGDELAHTLKARHPNGAGWGVFPPPMLILRSDGFSYGYPGEDLIPLNNMLRPPLFRGAMDHAMMVAERELRMGLRQDPRPINDDGSVVESGERATLTWIIRASFYI